MSEKLQDRLINAATRMHTFALNYSWICSAEIKENGIVLRICVDGKPWNTITRMVGWPDIAQAIHNPLTQRLDEMEVLLLDHLDKAA